MPETSLQERRREAFAKLLADDGSDAEDYAPETEEDIRPYLSGDTEIGRYVCVTLNWSSQDRYESKFFYYSYPNWVGASSRAEEFCEDDTFEEVPVKVVDLEMGIVWWARPSYLWTTVGPTPATIAAIRQTKGES